MYCASQVAANVQSFVGKQTACVWTDARFSVVQALAPRTAPSTRAVDRAASLVFMAGS